MVLNPIRIHSLLVMIVVILQSSTRFHLRLGLDLHRDSPILANRNPTDTVPLLKFISDYRRRFFMIKPGISFFSDVVQPEARWLVFRPDTPYPTTHEAHFIKTPPSIIKPFI
ncbi:hypothetical protein C8F04DRAFT_1128721 [Mycena alexandri]|uniref:Uncharacterized protein n=1 Tax=Mycena alexandri TaxID=1745969 RepID=A0AAD6WY24_9AGAR|nr:hypothetical protein C8F04DRAFT_1128721 [Mycena alexandri]